MDDKTQSLLNKRPELLLERALMLVLIILGLLIFGARMSAQSLDAAKAETGSIHGTVVDSSNDPIPGATVVLQGPAGDRLTAATKDDGTFAFDRAPAGVAYQIAVTAQGFEAWSSSVTVDPGQDKALTDVKLRIVAVERAVTVSYSSKEVAEQQLKVEEHQRWAGGAFHHRNPAQAPMTVAATMARSCGSRIW
jgi:hypothetical protein